jgi:hypothetical protein
MGSDDGSLSFSDSEGSYKPPSLASDSGPEDEELEADTDEDMNRSTRKKKKSGVGRQKPVHGNSKQNARGETKVCFDSLLQVFCL